jgi:hypothetical protein
MRPDSIKLKIPPTGIVADHVVEAPCIRPYQRHGIHETREGRQSETVSYRLLDKIPFSSNNDRCYY